MNDLGKLLVVVGLVIVLFGVVIWSGFGRGWLGRLPGDIHYSGKNVSFYFPVMTCVLLSVVLSIAMWLFRKF